MTSEKMRNSVTKSFVDTGTGPDDDGVYKRYRSNKRAVVKLQVKPLEPSPINFRIFQYVASMAMEGELADDMIDDDDDDDDDDDGVEEDEEEAYDEDE